MSPKNVYLIIGDGACGKSSLVRGLTGIYNTKKIAVQETEGKILDLQVWVRSAQEAGKSPKDVLDQINASPLPNALLTLRFDAYNYQPDAKSYFDLISSQHNIVNVIFMGSRETVPSFHTPSSVGGILIENSLGRPTNANASIVRVALNWL